MPRRTRTQLISQKKVRNAAAEPKPHGDMTFPAPAPRPYTVAAEIAGVAA